MHNSRIRIASIGALAGLVSLHGARNVGGVLAQNNELALLGLWDDLGTYAPGRPRAKHGTHKQRARQQIKAGRTRAGRRRAQHRR